MGSRQQPYKYQRVSFYKYHRDAWTHQTSSFASTFVHGITSISIICEFRKSINLLTRQLKRIPADYLPVFFQACLGASPIRSGVDMLATALVVAPFALVCGAMVQIMKKYRPANATGWLLTIIGFGLLTLLKATSNIGQWVGYQLVAAAGTGMIVSTHITKGLVASD